MRVYDMSGRMVRVLVQEIEEAGHNKVDWDGKDDMGRYVPSGIYLYRLKATVTEGETSFEETRKVILLQRRR
jgi:flagellar hook assembly protein FlgD